MLFTHFHYIQMNSFEVLLLCANTYHGLLEATLCNHQVPMQLLFECHVPLCSADSRQKFVDLLFLCTQPTLQLAYHLFIFLPLGFLLAHLLY
jgi:aspartate/glutamate racemase